MATKIGIPCGLIAREVQDILVCFLNEIGVETVLSKDTTREILQNGILLSPSESCLAYKIYLGHINELVKTCEHILIVTQVGSGKYGTHCSRYKAGYILATNIFREKADAFVEMTINLSNSKGIRRSLLRLGSMLGKPSKECEAAYRRAEAYYAELKHEKEKVQLEALASDEAKVLVVSHSYVETDLMMGQMVIDRLIEFNLVPILVNELPQTPEAAKEISKKIPWNVSNILAGAIVSYIDDIDGILLVSTFPCGPDSMINDLISRKIDRVPVLRLNLDEVEMGEVLDVRLESFSDVIIGRKRGKTCLLQK